MSANRIFLIYLCLALTLNLILSFFIFRNIPGNNFKLESKLNEIKDELAQKPTSGQTIKLPLDEPIAASEAATVPSSGYITISNDKFQDVSIYQDRSYSSKIISKAVFGKTYHYLKKEDGWYLISTTPEDKAGWVSGRFFKEITESTP